MPPSPPGSKAATLAFVIPWYGADARGGAELQGLETARALADRGYRIEILTTCSRSYMHQWEKNYHKPGEYQDGGITVRRFPVDDRETGLFAQANLAVLSGVRLDPEGEAHFVDHNINSRELYRFIEERAGDYIFIFLPYLYGTTLKGAAVRSDRSLVMPCFHVEPYVYLAASRRLMTEVRGLLFLTPEEKEAAESIVGELAPFAVVGGGIETGRRGTKDRFRQSSGIMDPYILYVGRLEWGKNTHLLVSYYQHWKEHSGNGLKLVLVGAGDQIPLGGDPSIISLGTLDDQQKMDACADAVALCQPSVNESFSRVIMESWLNEVPVMVHGQCPVTVGHCQRSGGGLYFEDYFQFAEVLGLLLGDENLRRSMGEAGRRYVLENYSWERVIPGLVAAVEELTGSEIARPEKERPG